jgi:hypothetical protein
MRSRAASKLSNWARDKNSGQIVAQKRSILPRVIGWCGRDLKCATRSFLSSASKRLTPRQLVYWRPLSVSISLGGWNSPTATRYTSITALAVGLRNKSAPTMNRE